MRGILLCDDLIDSSRVTATARALGCEVGHVNSAERLLSLLDNQTPELVILDLATAGASLEEVFAKLSEQDPPPRIVAYGPHVSAELLKSARQLGCDPVMPRSQFFSKLEQHLREWV